MNIGTTKSQRITYGRTPISNISWTDREKLIARKLQLKMSIEAIAQSHQGIREPRTTKIQRRATKTLHEVQRHLDLNPVQDLSSRTYTGVNLARSGWTEALHNHTSASAICAAAGNQIQEMKRLLRQRATSNHNVCVSTGQDMSHASEFDCGFYIRMPGLFCAQFGIRPIFRQIGGHVAALYGMLGSFLRNTWHSLTLSPRLLSSGDCFTLVDFSGDVAHLPVAYFTQWRMVEARLLCKFEGTVACSILTDGRFTLTGAHVQGLVIDLKLWSGLINKGKTVYMAANITMSASSIFSCPKPGCSGHMRVEGSSSAEGSSCAQCGCRQTAFRVTDVKSQSQGSTTLSAANGIRAIRQRRSAGKSDAGYSNRKSKGLSLHFQRLPCFPRLVHNPQRRQGRWLRSKSPRVSKASASDAANVQSAWNLIRRVNLITEPQSDEVEADDRAVPGAAPLISMTNQSPDVVKNDHFPEVELGMRETVALASLEISKQNVPVPTASEDRTSGQSTHTRNSEAFDLESNKASPSGSATPYNGSNDVSTTNISIEKQYIEPRTVAQKELSEMKAHFVVHSQIREVFRTGSLFAVSWHEGYDVSDIRRAVVLSNRQGFSVALPICSHDSGGCSSRTKCEREYYGHGIVYDQHSVPQLLADEENLAKDPVCIEVVGGQQLPKGSRINYSKPHCIEHNIKVKYLGRVIEEHVPRLLLAYRNENFHDL